MSNGSLKSSINPSVLDAFCQVLSLVERCVVFMSFFRLKLELLSVFGET